MWYVGKSLIKKKKKKDVNQYNDESLIGRKGDGGFGKLGHGDTVDVLIPKKVNFAIASMFSYVNLDKIGVLNFETKKGTL